MSERLTPPSFIRAHWRTVLPVATDGLQGVAFDLVDGRVVRLAIDAEAAWHLFDLLRQYRSGDPRFQSSISSGSSNREGSPQDGQVV